jgi:hypothetical protein
MGNLLELLRRLDAALIAALSGAFTAAGTSDEDQPVWSGAVAVVGALLVLAAGLALQAHVRVQLALVSVGMLLVVPYLQSRFDRARVAAEE